MIPKKIHYCWFGGAALPDNVKFCIESWHKFLPDYEIIEWNESNFDVNINLYVKEAAISKKWAFVADYARLYILYNEGGIYLDSDIEVLKSFDDLLYEKAFTGFESSGVIAAWLFGTVRQNPLFREFMDYYNDRHFIQKNGKFDLTPNTIPVSHICKKYGMSSSDTTQKLKNITIFPESFFCTKSIIDGKIRKTDNSYTIHHFDGSWQSSSGRLIKRLKYFLFGIFGTKFYPIIRKYYRNLIGFYNQ